MSEVSTQTFHVVARELNNELNDARIALELFGEQQDDLSALLRCREHLRSVRGALRLVEVFGAALLVEEMEQLTQYLIDHVADKRHLAEGLDALMRAMVQLPTYLERVLGGGRDMALVLLPLLNDLRAVRGNSLLSEGTLLLLNLSSDQQANPQAPSPGEPALSAAHWARRMRTRFQLGLLGWIKGEREDQNLEILQRSAEKLEQIATTQPVFQLWWVVGAVIEALRDHGLEGTASVKRLLGQADRQMKRLYEIGEQKYVEKPPLDLLNNLLYYVARATSDGPRVAAVSASFRLHELLPLDKQVEAARESLSAPSIKLMKTVAGAIKEDLNRVKDALDIFVRKGSSQPDELTSQLELLRKIGDTLGVLGLGELRERVQEQTGQLQERLQASQTPDEAMLMNVAATLISVEDSLDEQLVGLIMPSADAEPAEESQGPEKDMEFRQVSEAVLRECIVNLARIKESIAQALEKPGETQVLEQIPQLMRGITAGLLMLGRARAVQITERIREALARNVTPGKSLRMSPKMDRLADAIVAVEYYLETLQAGRSDPWYMLDNAEACLQALDELSTGSTGLHRIPVAPPEVPRTGTVALDPAMAHAAANRGLDPERTHVLHDGQPPVLTNTNVVVPGPQPIKADGGHETSEVNLPPVLERPTDKSDPEFLELFIEEARDEIAKLQRLLPQWDDDPNHQDALVQMRRSFHTLKGSGRLVGAQLIGEFAWSMEAMLNRVINRTLERTANMMTLMREAVAALPDLVEQLESGRGHTHNVGRMIAQAQSITTTRERARTASVTDTLTGDEQTLTQVTSDEGTRRQPRIEVPSSEFDSAPVTMDSALHDIFAKEVIGHLDAVRAYIAQCETTPAPYSVTETLHRACHTLNGASKTAGARQSIKIAEPLNHYIRKLYDNGAPLPAEGLDVLKRSVAAVEQVIANIDESTVFFDSQQPLIDTLQRLEERLDAELTQREHSVPDATGILRMDEFTLPPEATADVPQATPQPTDATTREERWLSFDSSLDDLLDEDEFQDAAEQAEPEVIELGGEIELDADGQELFIDETMQDDADDEVSVEFASEAVVETAEWAAHYAPPVLEEVVERPVPAAAPLHDSTMDEPSLDADFDADIAAIFTEEASELLEGADVSLNDWQGDRGNAAHLSELKRVLHTLKGGARMAGIRAMGDLGHELETLLERVESNTVTASPQVFSLLQTCLDRLHQMRDAVTQGRGLKPATELLAQARALMGGQPLPVESPTATAAVPPVIETIDTAHEPAPVYEAMGPVDAEDTQRVTSEAEHASDNETDQLLDQEVGQETGTDDSVWLEPAVEVEFGGIELTQVQVSPLFLPPTEETIDFELPDTNVVPQLVFEEALRAPVNESEREPQAPPPPVEMPVLTESFTPEPPVTVAPSVQSTVEAPPEAAPQHQVEAPVLPPTVLPPGREVQAQERGEVARVDAELLDNLLNNAGEVSILRSRLEQQVSSLEFNLSELSRTVTRLKDQLRNLEMETEAQILFKHQEDVKGHEEFDPLELDRYSTIQQLSRALAESVSDVDSIQGLLESMTREGQNLLLQQARVVTELQNGLMRTRMVPFSRHSQRLTRLVRQVAADTGKQVELTISGGSGELDRQVLERMLPPFEHMLRNSVVHGIETPEERVAKGKPAGGTIKVALHREGADMVITLADDGRGIDVNAVRAKAKAKGLIAPDRELTDEQAMQLILEPGFSTASTVTQHAGRGVGMDVVVNEIKKLGGALFTESEAGKGAKFSIRLPFTLAVSQSLLVRVGENELYAMPLATVEGVVRLPRRDVAAYLAEGASSYNYGGQVYRFQHLGAFIDAGPSLLPDEEDAPVPVVLIKAGEHSTALVADELVGNREVVVKAVGPQIAGIRGIAGATILGDGRVVIILDMGALVRSEWRVKPASEMTARGEDRRTFVLVVDDSITVRRVTQRLLERHGMRVLTAKDGLDALEILQEHVPDVILLDIEMPRMDGYELATQVRATPRLADIPIVMITSRVSEKHRARAIEIGVNDYLGKPYQENQLLDAIEPLVQARRRRVS